MKESVSIAFALLALASGALPSPNPQVSAWIWKQGADLPKHTGVGDKRFRYYFNKAELDPFPTEQDAYFSYNALVPVIYPVGTPRHYVVYPSGAADLFPFIKTGERVKLERDAQKGAGQHFTVECILERCYGERYEEQMIRALSERATQFGGPLNETAMLAKVNPVNIPVLRPGTPPKPFRIYAARYKIVKDLFPVRGDMLYVSGRQQFCETNAFDDLVSRYRTAYGVTPTFQSFVEGECRSNDANRVSYALFPLGIVVHRAQDYTEEFAHFVNVGDPYGGRDFEEFKAAYHGAKVDAWKMGIDLGVSGGWAQYMSALTADEDWAAASAQRLPANTLLMLQLYAAGGGGEEFRAWCESDAMGRMIL